MPAIPFCIDEKPFSVWSHDARGDNLHFLERVDAHLYFRTAHSLAGSVAGEGDGDEAATDEEVEAQSRKDVSSLSRLLWHHGMETLVMMLGAYMQAPAAAHAYFLKCKTEDAEAIAAKLLREQRPRYHRLSGDSFSLIGLVRGIHQCSGWAPVSPIIENFTDALRGMLGEYADQRHRWEYNSIKHGLRASHGTFALAVGLEESPGVEAPPEAMKMVGYSRDASFFDVALPLRNATKPESKIHFMTEKVSVSWSLEKVLAELQLISLLLHNIVSALRIVAGAPAKSVTFHKIQDDQDFWESYFSLHAGNVPSASMTFDFDARQIGLFDAQAVFDSYKRLPADEGGGGLSGDAVD